MDGHQLSYMTKNGSGDVNFFAQEIFFQIGKGVIHNIKIGVENVNI